MKRGSLLNTYLLSFVLCFCVAGIANGQETIQKIKSVVVSDNSLTISVVNFAKGPFNVVFNGTTLPNTYDRPAQIFYATLPAQPDPGTYLLTISKAGTILGSADVTVGAVGPQGPQGGNRSSGVARRNRSARPTGAKR